MVAVPIVYGVAALMAAIAALLAYMGTKQMFSPMLDYLKWILGPVSLVLDIVTNDATARMIESAQAAAESAATVVAHWIAAVPVALTQLVDAILLWAHTLISSTASTIEGAVTGAVALLLAAIQTAVNALRVDVDTLFQTYLPNLQWFIEQVQAELWGAVNALTARVAAVEQWGAQSIEAAVAGAVAALGASIEALRADVMQRVAGIEAGIEARIAAAVAGIDGYVTGLVDALAREIAAIRTALADAIPGINTRIDEVAAVTATTVAVIATDVVTVKKWIDDCGEPLCSHFTPEIPHLDALAALLASGAVAAWVIAAIEAPEATADYTDGLIGGVVSSVAGTLAAVG